MPHKEARHAHGWAVPCNAPPPTHSETSGGSPRYCHTSHRHGPALVGQVIHTLRQWSLVYLSTSLASSGVVTYSCVYGRASSCVATCGLAGVTIRTATCVSYSGGSTAGVPVTNFVVGNPLYADCGNCVSQTAPCPPVPGCEAAGTPSITL